jgi:hypothetical protein
MTLDLLDRAFLDRWQALPTATPSVATQPVPVEAAASAVPLTPVGAIVREARCEAAPAAADDVDRLLQAAWTEWCAVADEVEAARGRGRRVIAVVSCARGTGVSTLVEGLVRILQQRGRDAVAVARAGATLPIDGPTHDRRIVLVDAGIWFPPGRIHRQRVAVASAGCDAAILVRTADREPPAAWAAVLEALGVEPLGEVVSLAAPDTAGTAAEASP